MPSAFDHPFLNLARERVVILDGAMGTSLHRYQPDRQGLGPRAERQVADEPVGRARLHAPGVDRGDPPRVLRRRVRRRRDEHVQRQRRSSSTSSAWATSSTRSTGSTSASRRRRPRSSATPDRPRFVVGSIGPGTKMPSLTDPAIYADFDTLADVVPPADPGHDRGAASTRS